MLGQHDVSTVPPGDFTTFVKVLSDFIHSDCGSEEAGIGVSPGA